MNTEEKNISHSEINPKLGALKKLIDVLRGENGCPWDKEQTPASMSVYLIEEMYELVDAIAKGDSRAVCEELGDVLFHILFVTAIFEEKKAFDLEKVISRVTEKMLRRHPHVFGDASVKSPEDVKMQWRRIKKAEKIDEPDKSLLNSVPKSLPALMRAYRISERAAGAGFDWCDIQGVIEKAEEEWGEFKFELKTETSVGENESKKSLEFGDVLFTLINVARFAGIHPETALAESTRKFEKRFKHMEKLVSEQKKPIESASRNEMEELWATAKRKYDD